MWGCGAGMMCGYWLGMVVILFIVYCLLVIGHCLLFIPYSLFVIRHSLFAILYSLFLIPDSLRWRYLLGVRTICWRASKWLLSSCLLHVTHTCQCSIWLLWTRWVHAKYTWRHIQGTRVQNQRESTPAGERVCVCGGWCVWKQHKEPFSHGTCSLLPHHAFVQVPARGMDFRKTGREKELR